MPKSNRSQAIIYNNCEMLDNPKGTAKGMFINHNTTKIFILPGVPLEMKSIFHEYIEKKLPPKKQIPYLTLRSFGISESTLAEKISTILNKWNGKVEFAFLPSHKGVDLRLNSINNSRSDLLNVMNEIYRHNREYFYGTDDDILEYVLVGKLIEKKITLAVAESCTGGQLSNYITSVSGSSNIFKGGVIAYSNQVKIDILSVDKEILDKNGAVSDEVAIQMAMGVKSKMNSDIGIGITGISGPTGGTSEKPVGLVFIAVFGLGISKLKKFILNLDRNMHQEVTAYIALNMIRRYYFEK
tara:strand:- start:903 stop:1796 length:894 start_codon:yes stop_codon:yes gene_type:complete